MIFSCSGTVWLQDRDQWTSLPRIRSKTSLFIMLIIPKKIKSMKGNIQRMIRHFLTTNPWSFDSGVLILRFVCALMLLHGWPKFTGFSKNSGDWPDPFHVGPTASYALTVFAELFCTLFVVVGLWTRIALIPLVVCMVVIVFVIHAEDPFGDREHPLMYLMLYITLLFTGPGKYSLDRLIRKKTSPMPSTE